MLGIGMSSRATATEVRELVEAALAEHRLTLDEVALIATRQRFAGDPRLRLGPPVSGIDDDALEAASLPCTRSFGIRARVAETAAALAAGGHVVGTVQRSAHVTLAVAMVGSPVGAAAPPSAQP
ncbi:MAG: Cobalamin synthesis C-terminus [Ilumatobacteraceae bacterium]|nr:Cobalamin synthesis C-terminus [Ilumatobacteraceae bacterium]